ncbi:MAG: immune inhibitor A domain-containing protein, partial [Candidatus Latescibacterota bacterium]
MRRINLQAPCSRKVADLALGLLLGLILTADMESAWARPFRCAGTAESGTAALVNPVAAKPTLGSSTGTRRAIALFARFSGDAERPVPDWAAGIFAPGQPGSLSHFYDTMSLGKLQVRGEVGPRVYASTEQGTAYLADDSTRVGQFGRFSLEILTQADAEVDFSRYDNDGPDGLPDSGDDDGVVDAVFLVVASAPEGFILGAATGVAGLGFAEGPATLGMPVVQTSFVTGDRSVSGEPIRISADRGTIQQGRTLAEVVGSMCHEYGHVLGLPDLYNVGYLREPGAVPAADGAGVGAWCLMGWGALGWNGGDGPNSLCAWSRARLGWAQVLEPDQARTEMALEEVGLHGQVYQLPLSRRESFYLEYRRRTSTWYDRHLPAEGVLVWHVERTLASGDQPPRTRVDLECADGRWQDAGYPLGRQADPLAGGTNLDFWAHDAAYAQAHAGNRGDATDPFDGVRFAAFTPETNPAAVSHDGQHRLRLERLRLENGLARATVELEPALVEFTSMAVGDSLAMAGAAVPVAFTVANRGGTRAIGLRVRLLTEDPLVEILDPEIVLADLGVGQTSLGPTVSPQGYPRFRFFAGLQEPHQAVLALELYDAEGVLLDWGEVTVTGIPSYLVSGVVRDPTGQPLPSIPVNIQTYSTYASRGGMAAVQVHETTSTGSGGRYAFRVLMGTYSLNVWPVQSSPWGVQSLSLISVWSDTTFDFILPRAYRLRGHIFTPDGNVVGLLSLQLVGLDSTSSTSTWSGGDGVYDVKVPAGRYQLITGDVGPYPAQVVAEVRVEADQTLDLHLRQGMRLTLRVTGEQGEPVPDQFFYVQLLDGQLGSTVRTVISGPEGVGEVGVGPGRYIIEKNLTPAPYLPPARFQVEISGDTTVTVVLARGVRVSGRLLDESRNELPSGAGGSLSFSPLAGGNGNQCSFGIGAAHFSLGLAPGEYRAFVNFYYWPLLTRALPSQDLGTVEVRVDTTFDLLVRPGITVRGRLLDEAGGSLRTTEATLLFESTEGQNGSSTSVQPDGNYATTLLPGQYRVRLYPYAYASGALPQQVLGTFTATLDTTVDWIARTGERLVGRIVDTAGQGISGLYIIAQALDMATYGSSSIGQDWSFSLALFPGRYRLQANQIVYRPYL